MSSQPQIPKGKLVPHKTLQEITGFFSVQDGEHNWVLKVTVVVNKVTKTEMKDAEGRPVFAFQSGNIATLLTPEEYRIITGSNISP